MSLRLTADIRPPARGGLCRGRNCAIISAFSFSSRLPFRVSGRARLEAGASDALGDASGRQPGTSLPGSCGSLEGETRMHVSEILKHKGSDVITTGPGDTVLEIARLLSAKHIGAIVIRNDRGAVVGIISERDIIHAIAVNGERALEMPVRDVMTREVISCTTDDIITGVMKTMTIRRVRHVPVIEDGNLKGMVSIGDIVKNRLDETELEARVLRDYARTRR